MGSILASVLPIIDLKPLREPKPSSSDLDHISQSLHDAFSTTGFLYLSHPPLSLPVESILDLARRFSSLPDEAKTLVAKRCFNPSNPNTYRGYFPPQPAATANHDGNLKEGFDIGPSNLTSTTLRAKQANGHKIGNMKDTISLTEPTPWPPRPHFLPERQALERLHSELQSLSQRLLSLLAQGLGKAKNSFDYTHDDSISTLRLLHYPAPPLSFSANNNVPVSGIDDRGGGGGDGQDDLGDFICSPHTDSGILTLLSQDSTGGLEVLLPSTADGSEDGTWTPVPYLPNTLVVNVGDLMSFVSGGRYKATLHRVRKGKGERWSVPFFFEPGEGCCLRVVDGGEELKGAGIGEASGVLYGEHVREKMSGWIEFRGASDLDGEVK